MCNSVTQINHITDNNDQTNLTYDSLNRIKTANGSWGQGSFTYDKQGNIQQKNLGTLGNLRYQYNSKNQLSIVSGLSSDHSPKGGIRRYMHDPAGNVISNSQYRFDYNLSNRLIKVKDRNQKNNIDYF